MSERGPESNSTVTKSLFLEEELKFRGELGRGGFGVVREACYLGEKVAVKDFNSDSTQDNNTSRAGYISEQSILNEAYIMDKKRHKNTVRLIYHWRRKRRLVMECCGNGSLFDFIRNESTCSTVEDWSNRLRWMHGVALGMNALHSEPPSVLHRDLSSRNIFLDDHLEAKIGDYGMAKKMCEAQNSQGSCPQININMIYQPPEVREWRQFSTKSDVYSFGVIMHEMLCIKGPYGFNLNETNLTAKVEHYLMTGGKPAVSENRHLFPGKWYPCLEEYINLMNECLDDNPKNRPEFVTIEQRLLEIRKRYNDAIVHECSIKMKYRILKVFCTIFLVLSVVSLHFLCLILTIDNMINGTYNHLKMGKSVSLVFICITLTCTLFLVIVSSYLIVVHRKIIFCRFRILIDYVGNTCTDTVENAICFNWRTRSPEARYPVPSAFTNGPPVLEEVVEEFYDVEIGNNNTFIPDSEIG
eukprot:g1505.t1